jgi:hypothetical protein
VRDVAKRWFRSGRWRNERTKGTLNASPKEENGHRFFALRRLTIAHAFQQFAQLHDVTKLFFQCRARNSSLLH